MRIPIQSLWFFGWFFSWRFRMSCILVNLWRIFVFCELEFGIWNAHCHKLLQSFLQMILSRGDNSTDLCYTLNTYDGSTWAQTQKPLDLCLMPQPLIFPTQNYARKTLRHVRFSPCVLLAASCMYHHYIATDAGGRCNLLGTSWVRGTGRMVVRISVAWKNRRKNPNRKHRCWMIPCHFFFPV